MDKYRIYDKLFTPSTMTMRDGTIYAFIYDLKFLIVQKPSGFDGDSLIERYLSLEKVTDDAFRGLISYFDSIEDPTVVVFFGDHQPNDYVVEPVLNINGKNGKSLTGVERRMRYTVPYLIWANYDINGRSDLDISANHLGNLVLDAKGRKGYTEDPIHRKRKEIHG